MGRRAIVLVLLLSSFAAGRTEAAKGLDGVVNLNTAPPAVLALLPGVGPSKAAAILAYRGRRPFRTVDELVRIKGIGRKMVRLLRPHLAIAGPTTATATAATGKPVPVPAPSPPKLAPPPVRATGAPRCPPVRPLGRPGRTPGRDREPRRPFASPCLGPR